ncbi:MAG: hypothetical protein ACR2M1_15205 [Gemmatimonadaceae bacterium]
MDNANKNPQPNTGRPPTTPATPTNPGNSGTPAASTPRPGAQGAAGGGQPATPPNPATPPANPPGQSGGMAGQQGSQGTQGGNTPQQVKDSAKQLASETKHDVGSQLKSGVQAGKSRAVGALSGVAQSLESSAKQMRDQNQDGVGQYIDRAGQQVQRLADYLENTDISDMADQTEDFARKQPAVFLGGAFVLGLVGARFLKSSRRQEKHDQQNGRAGLNMGSSASRGSASMYDRERSMTDSGSTGPADTARGGMTGGSMTGSSMSGGTMTGGAMGGASAGGTSGISGTASQAGSSTGALGSTGSERR